MALTKRPAEELVADLETWVDDSEPNDEAGVVPMKTLRKWLRLARSIDARMRLDGSRLNKRKSAGAGRKRVTR